MSTLNITDLENKIITTTKVSEKIAFQLQLSDLQLTQDADKAIKILKDAERLALNYGLTKDLMMIYAKLGRLYNKQRLYDKSILYLQKALLHVKATDAAWCELSAELMKAYVRLGDFQALKEKVQIHLKMAHAAQLKEHLVFLHVCGAAANHRLQDYDQVEYHTKIAFEIGERLEQTNRIKQELAKASELVGRLAVVRGNFKKAIIYYQQAVDLATQVPNASSSIFGILNNFSSVYFEQGNFVKAFEKLHLAQEYIPAEKRDYFLAFSYSSIGDIYDRVGDYRQALDYNFKALKLMRKHHPKYYVVSKLCSIGQMLLKNKQYDDGLTYLLEAKALGDSINYTEYHNDIFMNMGNYYLMDGQYEKALTYFEVTLQNTQSLDNKPLMIQTLNLMGKTHTYQMDYEKAIIYHRRALTTAEMAEATYFQGVTLNFIGLNFFKSRKWEAAIIYTERALTFNLTGKYREEIEQSYAILYQVYELQKDFEQALLYFKLYKKFAEERQKKLNEEHISQLEINIQLQKKEQEIKLLNQKQVLLQKTNEDLNNFASMASHDLKEPLRMIQSFGNLLVRQHQHQLDTRGLEYLSYITGGAERMSSLINDLLAFVRAGKLEKPTEKVDLNKVLVMTRMNLKVKIKESNALIQSNYLPTIQAHFNPILQVFQNLLSNSIKFQKKDTQPVIIIKGFVLEKIYKISIQDNGIGIKKKDLKKIFDIFNRLHSKETYKGTGIGLAICKKVVESYNGIIDAESTLGKGTIFVLTFPRWNEG